MGLRSIGGSYVSSTLRRHTGWRGVFGGSSVWLIMFVAQRLLRGSAKVMKRGVMPIRFTESLQPGESFLIRHLDPNSPSPTKLGSTRGRRKTRQ